MRANIGVGVGPVRVSQRVGLPGAGALAFLTIAMAVANWRQTLDVALGLFIVIGVIPAVVIGLGWLVCKGLARGYRALDANTRRAPTTPSNREDTP